MTEPEATQRRFGLILAALVVAYTLIVALNTHLLTGPLRLVVVAAALLLAVRHRRSRLRYALILVAVAFAASLVAAFNGASDASVALSAAAMLVVVAATTVAIVQAVWRPVPDAQKVAGALTVYLLLALFFATVHQFCAAILPAPYLNGVSSAEDVASFLYFSVITITTTGFGDITPAASVARAVTLSESLVGQLYLVAIVGAVVSNFARSPHRRRPSAEEATPAADA